MTNTLWLAEDKKGKIISKSRIIIKDSKRLNALLKELRCLDNYIFRGSNLYPGSSENYLEYTPDGALEYENFGETEHYISSHFVRTYSNPRAEVYKLMTGDFSSNKNLLDLFATIEYGDNREKQLQEFKRAQILISQLAHCSLSNETLKMILKQMWPNFGLYATECLNFTDIKAEEKYNMDEITSIIRISKKNGFEVSSEIKEIIANQELAQSNGKVLTLSRKVNELSNGLK